MAPGIVLSSLSWELKSLKKRYMWYNSRQTLTESYVEEFLGSHCFSATLCLWMLKCLAIQVSYPTIYISNGFIMKDR
jgi:hypothetical protein